MQEEMLCHQQKSQPMVGVMHLKRQNEADSEIQLSQLCRKMGLGGAYKRR